MNGPHDLGGMMGFGPVIHEADEPVFHEDWEPRAFAINLAMGVTGLWNIDEARHARERLPPALYWNSSYYEMRHYALENQLEDLGLVTGEERAAGRSLSAPKSLKRVPDAAMASAILARGGPAGRACNRPAGFAIGDTVRTRNIHPSGHTRLPRYLRGHVGRIVRIHGTHVFPDSSAHGMGDDPQWLYAVEFAAAVVFGKDSSDMIVADLWEPYLEPAL
ncbi:MAG: nitrile hydratase subunit beta [Alphaproteobacteria bacterium]|nr:nitrile hydratase subunit beta [Alphaproteobacteria bacterium]